MENYKDNYKSIQINLLKDKHSKIIEWLEQLCEEEERSLNSIIICILKKEFEIQNKNEDK